MNSEVGIFYVSNVPGDGAGGGGDSMGGGTPKSLMLSPGVLYNQRISGQNSLIPAYTKTIFSKEM